MGSSIAHRQWARRDGRHWREEVVPCDPSAKGPIDPCSKRDRLCVLHNPLIVTVFSLISHGDSPVPLVRLIVSKAKEYTDTNPLLAPHSRSRFQPSLVTSLSTSCLAPQTLYDLTYGGSLSAFNIHSLTLSDDAWLANSTSSGSNLAKISLGKYPTHHISQL
jgi:hypothetical protein